MTTTTTTTRKAAARRKPAPAVPGNPDRALSICQPWAWAAAAGHKTIENRTWQTSYRGPIAIHSSLSTRQFTEENEQNLYVMGGPRLIDDCEVNPHIFDPEYFGAIIGAAELAEIVPLASIPGYDAAELDWGPNGESPEGAWAEGPYCWRLKNAVFFDGSPIKFPGKVNLFSLPPAIAKQVADRLDCLRSGRPLPKVAKPGSKPAAG